MDLIAKERLHGRDGISHGDKLRVQTLALVEAFLQSNEGGEKLHIGRGIGRTNRLSSYVSRADEDAGCQYRRNQPHNCSFSVAVSESDCSVSQFA